LSRRFNVDACYSTYFNFTDEQNSIEEKHRSENE
jgi:hypothetical protein